MPRKRITDAQVAFDGGLNLSADITQLKPTELRKARNARLTEYGGATKRGALQRIHVTAIGSGNPVLTGGQWVRSSGVQQLTVSNGLLHTATYGIPCTWTAQVGGLSTTVRGDIESFRDGSADVAYIADGGPINKWNGTTLTLNIASTPNATQLAVYNLRLFGITGSDSTLYWSDIGNGDTLGVVASGGGQAIIRTFAQQDLIGLLPLGSSLCLVHRAGVSRFTGWSQDDIDIDAGTQGISADTGTIAPRSLVSVENVGFMVSDRSVYEITEFGVRPIGQPIESMLRALDHSTFSRIQGVHHKAMNEVHFYFPDVGVYVYNYRLEAWTGPFDGSYISPVTHSMWQTVDAQSIPIVLVGGADGFIRRADAPGYYKDDILSDGTGGTAYTLELQCHRMVFKNTEMTKAFRFLYTTASADAGILATISWTTESGTSSRALPTGVTTAVWDAPGAVWDAPGAVWPATLAVQPRRNQCHGHGTFIDVTITDDSNSAALYSRVRVDAFEYALRF